MDLFAWQTLVFLIPLVGGVLLAAGSIFGFGDANADADGDADMDADTDADAESDHASQHALDGHEIHHDGHGSVSKALSILGIGRAPMSLVLSTAALTFGGIGFIANSFLSQFLPGWLYGLVSLPIAFVGMVALTGRFAGFMSKIMPATETYVLTKRDLITSTGELILPAGKAHGLMQVHDRGGNVINASCRTNGEELQKNAPVLVIDYDQTDDVYVVERLPPDLEEKA
ncbi:DUF1449 family protein [Candidatus Uhrbacteria bacterium]|nr:DUF1449 family protein [Candidatus Uhrbacteria bacterium]